MSKITVNGRSWTEFTRQIGENQALGYRIVSGSERTMGISFRCAMEKTGETFEKLSESVEDIRVGVNGIRAVNAVRKLGELEKEGKFVVRGQRLNMHNLLTSVAPVAAKAVPTPTPAPTKAPAKPKPKAKTPAKK